MILGRLVAAGYELTPDLDAAETVIVNTCGFIDEAKQESIDTILEVAAKKEDGVVRELLVAGCMAQQYGQELRAEIPEIDGFLSLDDLRRADQLVGLGGAPAPPRARSLALFDHTDPRRLTTPGYAYLKVAEGCNNPCTFCAIPLWRGRFRSRTIESLVEEARQLEATGVQELCLVAQDTTRYGEDLGLGRHGLLRLVEALLQGTNVPWVRWLYAYPTTLDRELLRLMGSEERVCRYLDIPLQHSHPQILRAMRRAGDGDRYLALLDQAREAAPDIWLRSTFIVGFPGETDEHFEHLERFLERAALDHVGAFTYSGEDGTPAAEMAERPAPAVARERQARLLERQRPIALARRRSSGRPAPAGAGRGRLRRERAPALRPPPRHGARHRRAAADRRRLRRRPAAWSKSRSSTPTPTTWSGTSWSARTGDRNAQRGDRNALRSGDSAVLRSAILSPYVALTLR